MPSVFTVDGDHGCPWTLKYGRPRQTPQAIFGCFKTKKAAERRAAMLNVPGARGSVWSPIESSHTRPPGVPASLAGYGKYHRDRADHFDKQAKFHIARAKAANADFDCLTALREARRAAREAGKASVNAWDSKFWKSIDRSKTTERRVNEVVDSVGKRCFAAYARVPFRQPKWLPYKKS